MLDNERVKLNLTGNVCCQPFSSRQVPLTHPPPRILVPCLCKTSTEEMTSLRKLDVSFTRGQQNVLVRPTTRSFLSSLSS